MKTMKEYIQSYTYSFQEKPFQEVDNLVFASFSYLNLSGIVPEYGNGTICVADAYQKYLDMYYKDHLEFFAVRGVAKIFEAMAKSKRYRDVMLSNYSRLQTDDMQFGAITLTMPDGSKYISFEGTDDSIVGWKESCSLCYQYPIPAQKAAVSYLNKVVSFFDNVVYVGGHSKGGNLAMYAAMKCAIWVKPKVKKVYNNDGPGFFLEQTKKHDYRQMVKKLCMFVPGESVFGMMLIHPSHYKVVKSRSWGVWQHAATTWLIEGDHFVSTKQGRVSIAFGNKVNEWLAHVDFASRKRLVDVLFRLVEESGITTFSDLIQLKLPVMIEFIQKTRQLNKEEKTFLVEVFTLFLRAKNVSL